VVQATSSTAGNTPVTVPPPPPPPLSVTVVPLFQAGAAAAAVNTLLTPRTAATMRARTNIATTCKQEMRALLDKISATQPRDPTQIIHQIPPDVAWRHYIARHPECERIIGTGIVRACLEFLPGIRDPNRGGQPRLDFVFENAEGVRCQLHPGGKGPDAKPIYTSV
jgi:hypothetical protein